MDQGTERERRRRCTIFYYLEDDSVQVMEPVEHNSGIPQGREGGGYRLSNQISHGLSAGNGRIYLLFIATSHLGTIVRRHRIPFTYDSSRPKPSSRTHPEHHITFYDLNVHSNLNIYGRVSVHFLSVPEYFQGGNFKISPRCTESSTVTVSRESSSRVSASPSRSPSRYPMTSSA